MTFIEQMLDMLAYLIVMAFALALVVLIASCFVALVSHAWAGSIYATWGLIITGITFMVSWSIKRLTRC